MAECSSIQTKINRLAKRPFLENPFYRQWFIVFIAVFLSKCLKIYYNFEFRITFISFYKTLFIGNGLVLYLYIYILYLYIYIFIFIYLYLLLFFPSKCLRIYHNFEFRITFILQSSRKLLPFDVLFGKLIARPRCARI